MPRYKKVSDNIPSYTFWDLDQEKKIHVANRQVKVTSDMTVFHPHRLGYYAIRLITAGSAQIFIDHIPYNIEENWVMLATPEQISWVNIPENTEIKMSVIAFNKNLIDLMGFAENATALITGLSSHLNTTLSPEDADIVKNYFVLILREFEHKDKPNYAVLAALTKALLLRLYNMHHGNTRLGKRRQNYLNIYRQFLGTLENNYKDNHYVADYVDSMLISEKQLNRACKAITNSTAGQIIQQRLDFEAKRLLFYTPNTVKEIGYHLGFKDPAHFNKFFKKQNLITPREFRLQF